MVFLPKRNVLITETGTGLLVPNCFLSNAEIFMRRSHVNDSKRLREREQEYAARFGRSEVVPFRWGNWCLTEVSDRLAYRAEYRSDGDPPPGGA